nr:DNA-processing protein DprA [Fusobacterium nucleatum]
MEDLRTIIQALLLIKGINRKTIHTLSKKVDTLLDTDALIYALNNFSLKNNFIDKNLFFKMINEAQKLIDIAISKDIKVISFFDSLFPERLKHIIDPPVLIFAKGNIDLLSEGINIGIIGTRNPSEHGKEVTKRLSKIFTEKNCNIVSGLAKGCDSIAHSSCLENNGKTIAILPSGVENVFPKSNLKLAKDIVLNNGILLSEYPINHKPFKGEYVERDRLQSALSETIIIVESGLNGGSMHTASYAIKQKKILACYENNKKYNNDPIIEGNKKLISEGAFSISDKASIEEIFKRSKKMRENLKEEREKDEGIKNIIKYEQLQLIK